MTLTQYLDTNYKWRILLCADKNVINSTHLKIRKILEVPSACKVLVRITAHRLRSSINHLTPNGHFSGRTAPLTSRRCILYISLTNIRAEYFKHAAHSPFFPLQKCRLFHNATFFGTCIIHILYTGVLKFERKFRRQRVNSRAKIPDAVLITIFPPEDGHVNARNMSRIII
jgi:hypothetical protein